MRTRLPFPCLLLVAALCFFLVGTGEAAAQKKKPPITLNDKLLKMCDARNPISTKRQKKELTWMVEVSGKNSLLLNSSPQHLAGCWILYHDRKQSKGRGRKLFLQRYALAVLHFGTTKSNTTSWDWFMTVDEPKAEAVQGHWMSPKHHECSWYGVHCSMFGYQMYKLVLGYMKLDGILPREMYLLPGLKEIDMHGNDYQGILPMKMLTSLTKLERLYLHMNGFFGSLHKEIAGLKSLKELILFGNYFASTLPKELSKLTNLEAIDLYANFITGTIPSELGKLRKLRRLDLHDNNIVGKVPDEICAMNLEELLVDCLGPNPEVRCTCCTVCCRGLPDAKCVDVKTGKDV